LKDDIHFFAVQSTRRQAFGVGTAFDELSRDVTDPTMLGRRILSFFPMNRDLLFAPTSIPDGAGFPLRSNSVVYQKFVT
jgi:hypothetical protein